MEIIGELQRARCVVLIYYFLFVFREPSHFPSHFCFFICIDNFPPLPGSSLTHWHHEGFFKYNARLHWRAGCDDFAKGMLTLKYACASVARPFESCAWCFYAKLPFFKWSKTFIKAFIKTKYELILAWAKGYKKINDITRHVFC